MENLSEILKELKEIRIEISNIKSNMPTKEMFLTVREKNLLEESYKSEKNGTLTIQAPQLSFESIDTGSISLNSKNGSIQFLFEAETPPLPYDSAFYFASKELRQGTLIYGQTANTGSDINLLELSSGLPTESKFTVDGDGNVHVRGNIVLEGNLIVNPNSSIFGSLSTETATSSFSPEP